MKTSETMHCMGLQSSLLTANFLLLTLKTQNRKEHIDETAINFLVKPLGERTNSLKWNRRAPRQNLVVRILTLFLETFYPPQVDHFSRNVSNVLEM